MTSTNSAEPLICWQVQANQWLMQGNYAQAAQLYEQAIESDPEERSYYWQLGLLQLLQGEEAEAQATWLFAISEGESHQIEQWVAELAQVLQTEAERRETLADYSTAWAIRQHLREVSPDLIHNVLQLLPLSIELNLFTDDTFEELGLPQALHEAEVNAEFLLRVLKKVLYHADPTPSLLKFAEGCIALTSDTQALMQVLLPASIRFAYSKMSGAFAADLVEAYLRLDPDNIELLGHLSLFYQNAKQYDRAIQVAERRYELTDYLPEKIFSNHLILRGLLGAGGYWQEALEIARRHESLLQALVEQQPTDVHSVHISRLLNAAYYLVYFYDQPQRWRTLENQLLEFCQKNTQLNAANQGRSYQHSIRDRSPKRLKIGYLSHCMATHSVGWLARCLIQHHDRDRFELYGYFLNYRSFYDPLQEWYVDQFDHVHKIESVGLGANLAVATQIQQDEIDILIDLDSITLDLSCQILALKPAPIQATWLGWDASGLPAIDYFIADPYVLPDSAQAYYSEKIWRLPQTYVGIDGFEVGIPTLRREDLNIPNDAIVFLSAQRGYKRHRDTVKLQMRILKQVPNSYFLIKGLSDQESISKFFAEVAEEEGVSSDRLRFLPDDPSVEIHRANLAIADVVLDTFPYNGATTTLEALWMEIPLVTKVGEQFAARNSYTMLTNVGLTEGIAWTDEDYVNWGVRLGTDAALRQQIAWKLRRSKQTAPLWNGKQFTHEMEKAYEQMWTNYLNSASPKSSAESLSDRTPSLTSQGVIRSSRPLKILVITNLYPPQVLGGYERSIADFARLLQHRGHTVLVLTSDTPQFSASHTSLHADPPVDRCLSLMGEWSSQGARLFDHPRVADVMQQNQAILKHHLDHFQPDVCLAGNLRFVQLEAEGMALLLSHQVPVAHYLMNAQADYAPQHTPRSPLYRLITCSDWVTASLQTLGYSAATAQTIYPGADVDAFYQAELPPHDRLRIAYASLVTQYKGADVLVEALSLLHAAGIEFTATIAGGTFQPEFVEALKQYVESEGLQESIQFTGALSRQELIQLYKTHNVLVFPSRFDEPFGISQIEAMAAGLTLITSGTGGARELIAESGKDGLIFESENPFDLADTLSSLPTDPVRWEAISRNGQQRAMSEFNQVKAVEKLETAFLGLTALKGIQSE